MCRHRKHDDDDTNDIAGNSAVMIKMGTGFTEDTTDKET